MFVERLSCAEERECHADQEKLSFFIALVLAAAFLSGCSSYMIREAKGVPVKTLKPSVEDVAAAERVRQEMEKEIAAMASVTGNNSFTETERNAGVPSRPRGRAEDHLLGRGQEHGVHRARFVPTGRYPMPSWTMCPVSGRTVGELHEALVEGLKSTSGARGSRSSSRSTRASRFFCSVRSTRFPRDRRVPESTR